MSELSRPASSVNEPRKALLIDSSLELNRMLTLSTIGTSDLPRIIKRPWNFPNRTPST